MDLQEIYRYIVFGLLIVHFLISSSMWIINDKGKTSSKLKMNLSLSSLCDKLKNNSKVYLLSVIICGVSILFIALVLFEKPVKEGLDIPTPTHHILGQAASNKSQKSSEGNNNDANPVAIIKSGFGNVGTGMKKLFTGN